MQHRLGLRIELSLEEQMKERRNFLWSSLGQCPAACGIFPIVKRKEGTVTSVIAGLEIQLYRII